MRRIAIINQKGGVGKTTTTVNVGVGLARAGHRVLLIDLDPQSHLSLHLGMDPTAQRPGTYELLTGSDSISKTRVKVASNLWVVGSSIDLAAAEVELVSVVGREVILRDLLDQHLGAGKTPQYDYVLMDCPPSLGVLTLNGLCAAHEVIIPLQPHYLALQGLGKLLETVSLVGKRINPGLKVTGVVVCMHDAGTKLATEVVDDVRAFFEHDRKSAAPWAGAKVFETVIRRNIKLAESPSYGKSIFEYAPDSNGAKDYEQLAAEVDGRTIEKPKAAEAATVVEAAPPAAPAPVAPSAPAVAKAAPTPKPTPAPKEPAAPAPKQAAVKQPKAAPPAPPAPAATSAAPSPVAAPAESAPVDREKAARPVKLKLVKKKERPAPVVETPAPVTEAPASETPMASSAVAEPACLAPPVAPRKQPSRRAARLEAGPTAPAAESALHVVEPEVQPVVAQTPQATPAEPTPTPPTEKQRPPAKARKKSVVAPPTPESVAPMAPVAQPQPADSAVTRTA